MKQILFSFLATVVAVSGLIPEDGLQDLRSETLDENYVVEWQANFSAKTVDFWIGAKTTGFVGFGIAIDGKMNGADLVVGGVRDGVAYFGDYHGGDHVLLPDVSQDWEAVNITEVEGATLLHLRRKFDTCDDDDLVINEGTVKLLWSMGATDDIGYHSDRRGAYAVNMLDPPPVSADLTKFETFNLTTTITLTPEDSTLYWCSIHKREALEISQVVAFKPKFDTPEALKYTHHFNVYYCKADPDDPEDIFEEWVNHPGDNCINGASDVIQLRSRCAATMYAWSFGGRVLVLPDDVGLSWGTKSLEYFYFEVHLDNQARDSLTFETGVTFYHTTQQRPLEAGVLTVAHGINAALMIPPRTTDWTIVGHCSPTCTQPQLPPEGITLFNVNLHAHVSGRRMRFRHFRDGKELPWIANDESYDFDFQENRPLAKQVQVLPGDHLALECTFESNWKAPKAVIGGYSSYDEMCMVFAMYYPKTNLDSCYTWSDIPELMSRFGIQTFTQNPEPGNLDPVILEPVTWFNRTYTDILENEVEWTDGFKLGIQQFLRYGSQQEFCFVVDNDLEFNLKNSDRNKQGWIKFGNRVLYGPKATTRVTYPEHGEDYQDVRNCTEVKH